MAYYDQHMHTHFSPDSAESFENYLEQTDGLLVTTEHLDFHDAYNGGVDTVLDYAAYIEKIDALNAVHDGRIRRGIEVGYTPESHARIDVLSGRQNVRCHPVERSPKWAL